MRAVRLAALGAPLIECDIDEPNAGRGEVRVRVEACGICHSDAHYRSGFGAIATPRTLGHEIAGTVTAVGDGVTSVAAGDRVAIHYLLSCGECRACRTAGEQFCESGRMIGKQADGGHAESIVVPEANAIPIPPNVPFEVAAVMMCSTATAYHALRVAGVQSGSSVAVLGFGGLGVSAVHLSRLLGAAQVAVVDVVDEKLAAARSLGAQPIDARSGRVRESLLDASDGFGFDFAADFTGRPETALAALQALAPKGTLVVVALSEAPISFNPYRDVLGKERRVAGCSDHLRSELVELMQFAGSGKLDLASAISRRIPLDAGAINETLDELERGTSTLRTVITTDR